MQYEQEIEKLQTDVQMLTLELEQTEQQRNKSHDLSDKDIGNHSDGDMKAIIAR